MDGSTNSRFNLIMLRCLSCNGILAKNEKTCYSCGEVSPEHVKKKKGKGKGLSTVVTIAFFASLALTGLALFSNFGPPLVLSVALTLVLLFVKSSSDQFGKNRS
jgi:hypothetical protein